MARYLGLEHHRSFIAANGEGPWDCASCGEEILKIGKRSRDGAIHHKNENKHDNDPANLEMHHFGCHRRLHTIGDINPAARPEVAAKISASLIGHEVTAETRAKIGAANKGNKYCLGRVVSDETKQRMSDSVKTQRIAVCECGKSSRPGSMAAHFKATGHKEVMNA